MRAKECIQGTVCIEPDKRESMLHMEGQAQYVEGVLQGAVGVDPVCMEGVFAKADQGCSRTKQLGQNSAGEMTKDQIRG